MKKAKQKILSPSGLMMVFLAWVIVLWAPFPGLALTIYDESMSGDLSNLDMPIQFTLRTGSNQILGAVSDPFDTFDPFGFVVPSGEQLDQIIFLELGRTVAFTLFTGPTPLLPNDIGSVVVQPADIGKDLLPSMALSPLSSGGYSARIFAADEPQHPYHLDLRVVPEPSVLLLLGSGLLGVIMLRKPKSFLLPALLCACLLGFPLLSAAGQVNYGYHGATGEVTWRGTQALKLCNGLFVSGRTLDQIYAQEMVNPRPEPTDPMPLDRVEIDYQRKAVAVGVGDSKDPVPAMRAAYREGIGCVVMGIDQTFADIEKLPKLEMAPLPGDPATTPWPNGDLVEKKPQAGNIDEAALKAAGEWTFDRAGHGGHKGQVTLSLLVVHRGEIIYERYAPGVNMHTRTRTWSTAKSISSTITGIAVDKGLLDLNGPLPFDWPPDPRKGIADPRKAIKLRDVLHMSSGLYPVDTYRGPGIIGSHLSYFSGWDSGYEARNRGLIREPGSVHVYENYDTLLGVFALRTALGNDKTYAEFPRRELLDRIGMRGTLPGMDRFGNFVLSSQVYTNARDLARVGILYLNQGVWNGERILSKEWVDWVRMPAKSTRNIGNTYGGQFWLVPDKRTDLPQDAYSTSGARGQFAVIVPSYDLVVVRRGLDWRAGHKGLDQWDMLAEILKAFPPPPQPPKKLPSAP